MAWSTPRAWVANEIITAAIMNTHVRDQFLETAPAKAAAAGDIFYATALNAIAKLPIGGPWLGLMVNAAGNAPQWSMFGFRQAPLMAFTNGVASGTSPTDVVSFSINTTAGSRVFVLGIATIIEVKSAGAQWGHSSYLDFDGSPMITSLGGVFYTAFNANQTGYMSLAGPVESQLVMAGYNNPSAGTHTYKVRAQYQAVNTTPTPQASGGIMLFELTF